ncbi:MAG: diguanylate cyclase [Paraburkholderia sp.]|nr:diguanylate cyclase [Paraburkholderia sp.]
MSARQLRSVNADRNRFIALYIGIVVGLLVAAGVFFYEARIVIQDGLRDEQAVALLTEANDVFHDLESAETGQRGYLLTGNADYLTPYYKSLNELSDTMLRLQRVAQGDARSREIMLRVERMEAAKMAEIGRTVVLARSGNRDAAIALVKTNEGRLYMESLRQDLGLLLSDWRQRRTQATEDAHERLVLVAAVLAVFAVLVGFLMVYAIFVQRRAFAKIHAWSQEADRRASHDALTGLPNRRQLQEAIDAAAADTRHGPRRIALLYLDIDGFKSVNDALGHSAGDALLRRLAQTLRSAIRSSDLLVRVGGDEFVLLVADCGDDALLAELAERLIAGVRMVGTHAYDGRFPIGVSIGIATFPDSAEQVDQLLDVADAAMYEAKRSGRSTYVFSGSTATAPSNVVALAG